MESVTRSLLSIAVCFGLLVLQSMISVEIPLHPWAPNLLLPIVVYYGLLQEVNVVRGMAIAFASGYLLDLFGGSPMSLYTFVQCASFLVSRALGLRLFLRNVAFQASFAFVASLAAQGAEHALRALFEKAAPFTIDDSKLIASSMAASATTTAIFAPIVFAIIARIESSDVQRRDDGSVST